ncbi:sigma-54-dependent transcriptional regulator [Fusibacter ferrireducens]|uniref:Stage 0 sporulation protein A homolog n=1 Tax=Fusibacter ferrireducens TaxID=2785058 RepID=A0ABR9ZNY0_9FIRM|nr:sigma-54 dependent transcriptional regulator [Fusibacter ferrireducens]MBF4692170.1 sigma-54-dependent Fis family transcriptional regulator [Fusibacter ferrireducens]
MKIKLLIIDDESLIRKSLSAGLRDAGYEVASADSRAEGLRLMEVFRPHIVLTDMRLGKDNGVDLIPELKAIDNDTEIIVMTAYSDLKSAITAIKLGAFDYINKPFDLDHIKIVIHRAFECIKMTTRLLALKKHSELYMENMIGSSPVMMEVYKKIEKVSSVDNVTVLIRGETGTGKELVAEAIHKNSKRKNDPLLRVNCSAIPKNLVESELFGFEKNAFTGANSKKKGLFEIADGGIVFLDEFGELPLETQSKLLRFLEEKRFRRIGGLEDIEVDIRIVVATNKNLEEAVKKGEFREDLYYRINTFPINIPPLRKRGDDILLLADFYLKKFSQNAQKDIACLNVKVKEQLLKYPWPGNVRELRNVIERLVILSDKDVIDASYLPPEIRFYKDKVDTGAASVSDAYTEKEIGNLNEALDRVEKHLLTKALDKYSWNQTKTAEILGITRFTLKRKMEKHGL